MKDKNQEIEGSEEYYPANDSGADSEGDACDVVSKVCQGTKTVDLKQFATRRTTRSQSVAVAKEGDTKLMDDGKSATPKPTPIKRFNGKHEGAGSKPKVIATTAVEKELTECVTDKYVFYEINYFSCFDQFYSYRFTLLKY